MKDSNLRDASADDEYSVTAVFARNLRRWRRERGLSQKELAKKAGIGETTVIAYEQGTRVAGIDKIEALATALDCLILDLLEDDFNRTDEQAVKDWRMRRCIEIATMASYVVDWDKESKIVRVLSFKRDGNITVLPTRWILTEDFFIAYFERINALALANTDLSEIADSVLEREYRIDQ